MNANTPKPPKPWEKLTQTDRDKLIQYAKDVAFQAAEDQFNKDIRIIVDRLIKMQCILMHDTEGYGERRLNRYLWNHRRFFRKQIRLVRDDKQTEYLNRRMAEIFKKDGFPQHFLDDILGEVEGE